MNEQQPATVASNGGSEVEGLSREQFGQLPRIVQWALAGKYGVPRVERIRDARQERISWSLGKTPGGTGGDPAPHSFYTDDRDLFAEIVARPHASGKLGHLGRGGESPHEDSRFQTGCDGGVVCKDLLGFRAGNRPKRNPR